MSVVEGEKFPPDAPENKAHAQRLQDKEVTNGWDAAEPSELTTHERKKKDSDATPAATPVTNHRALGTGDNIWNTPPDYITLVRNVLGEIDLDPATNAVAQEWIKARKFYTEQDDGLTKDWTGRVWLNPPYSQPDIHRFVEKLVAEVSSGRVTEAVLLTHNYTDTRWFHLAESKAALICFTRGRIAFTDIDGAKASPTQGQALFYYGTREELFTAQFQQVGFIR
jgi:phage N-6-adenine-methyltransferase